MSFGPRIQKQEGFSWPKEGCPLQKVILLMPDVTQDGQQGSGVSSPGLRELLSLGMCGYTGGAKNRSLGSTKKVRLPEHKGDDAELKQNIIEDLPLR